MTNLADPAFNPYAGPRPYREDEPDWFFGRDEETDDLVSLLRSDSAVLLYSPPGAGKSSLINTRLSAELARVFGSRPTVVRVGGNHASAAAKSPSVYLDELILALADLRKQPTPELSKATTLSNYLNASWLRGQAPNARRRILILDQFEEVFAPYPNRRSHREEFFKQLREALLCESLSLSLVIALRETYVADLDRYSHLLPGRLRARYYLRRLGPDQALAAIKGPAALAGRPFAADAAAELQKSLLWFRVNDGDEMVEGEMVEPIKLQIVCWQIWEDLKAEDAGSGEAAPAPGAEGSPAPARTITLDDLKRLQARSELAGDVAAPAGAVRPEQPALSVLVENALARFYEICIRNALAHGAGTVWEYELRDWIEEWLIAGARTRSMVCRIPDEPGSDTAKGLPFKVLDGLKPLIVDEPRDNQTWYRLVHDDVIEPVRASNEQWFASQPAYFRLAHDWKVGARNAQLAQGKDLKAIERYVLAEDTAKRPVPPVLREYFAESKAASSAARKSQLLKLAAPAIVATLLLAAVFITLNLINTEKKLVERTTVGYLRALPMDVREEVSANPADKPQLSLLLAVEALASIRANPVELALDRIVSGAVDNAREGVRGTLENVLTTTESLPLRTKDDLAATQVISTAVAVSADGHWVAAAGTEDGGRTLHVWDLSGESPGALWDRQGNSLDLERWQSSFDDSPITALAFDPSSARLILGQAGGCLSYLDMSARTLRSLTSDECGGVNAGSGVRSLKVSPGQGRWLAVTGPGSDLELFTLEPGAAPLAPAERLGKHMDGIGAVDFSPDERWLATVDGQGAVRLWDLSAATALPVDDPRLNEGKHDWIAFSQDSKWLAAAGPESDIVYLFPLPLTTKSTAYTIKPVSTTDGKVDTVHTEAKVKAITFAVVDPGEPPQLVVSHQDGEVLLWHLPAAGTNSGQEPPGDASTTAIGKGTGDSTAIGKNTSETTAIGKGSGDAGSIGKDGGGQPADDGPRTEKYREPALPALLSTRGPALIAGNGRWLLTASNNEARLCRWDLKAAAAAQEAQRSECGLPLSGLEQPGGSVALYPAGVTAAGDPKWVTVDANGLRVWGLPPSGGEIESRSLAEVEALACRRAGRSLTEEEIKNFKLAQQGTRFTPACERILSEWLRQR